MGRHSRQSYSDVILRLAKGGRAIHPHARMIERAATAPRSLRDETLTTYIALFSLTEAGIKAAKDSPRRLDAAKKLLADMGGEMKQFYLVMGEFDFVGICEAPDDAVMARYVPQLGGLGFVRTKTLKAFPETAYREIVRSLA